MDKLFSSKLRRDELRHYSRQIAIPQFGAVGQQRLKECRIAVIGAGGLGAPLLQYLAAAGAGTIGIFDDDVVEESNLHRQVLFNVSDIGKSKAKTAATKLKRLNPHITVEAHHTRITPANSVKLLEPYNLAADGSDNFLTRYAVNDACLLLDIPLVYGSVYRFEGQVTVFNYADSEGRRGPELHDLYPEMPSDGFIPDCSTAGVLGVLPGVIGSLQATEAIKIAAGIGDVLSGRLLVMNLLHMETQMIVFSPPEKNRTIDTEAIQKRLQNRIETAEGANQTDAVVSISAEELYNILKEGGEVELIDVRSPEEHHNYNIGGTLAPLDVISKHPPLISGRKKTVVYCQTGKRSVQAIRILQEKSGYTGLYNLKGGIDAWRGQFLAG